jgi:hypothetical protein
MNRIFFHVTKKENLPSIMQKGLLPHACELRDKNNKPVHDIKAIFFVRTLRRAKMLALYGDIILQVNVPKGCQIYRRINPVGYMKKHGQYDGYRPYEYCITEKIPPERLKVVHEEPTPPEWMREY